MRSTRTQSKDLVGFPEIECVEHRLIETVGTPLSNNEIFLLNSNPLVNIQVLRLRLGKTAR